MGALFRAGQHEVNVRVAIGDETFHTIQAPGAIGILGGLQHYALQVRASVGLGEVHRHGFASTHTRNVFLTLLF